MTRRHTHLLHLLFTLTLIAGLCSGHSVHQNEMQIKRSRHYRSSRRATVPFHLLQAAHKNEHDFLNNNNANTQAALIDDDKRNTIQLRGGSGSDVAERTTSAIVMLAVVTLLVKKFGQNGIIGLILLSQTVMYHEACKTVSLGDTVHFPNGMKVQQWWWYLTVQCGIGARFLNLFKCSELGAFGMAALSLVLGVVTMAHIGFDYFQPYLSKVASSHFALLFLVVQSSTWFLTLQEFGTVWFFFPALLVIVNDTMAYVFGRLIGKNKLVPKLSPKKTKEGFWGAAVSTIAVASPLLRFMLSLGDGAGDFSSDLQRHAIAIALYVSIVSPFGGFLASAVKRTYGAKDFGAFIPGHGGAIDRLDCQIVTAPFVYFYLKQYF